MAAPDPVAEASHRWRVRAPGMRSRQRIFESRRGTSLIAVGDVGRMPRAIAIGDGRLSIH